MEAILIFVFGGLILQALNRGTNPHRPSECKWCPETVVHKGRGKGWVHVSDGQEWGDRDHPAIPDHSQASSTFVP